MIRWAITFWRLRADLRDAFAGQPFEPRLPTVAEMGFHWHGPERVNQATTPNSERY